MADAAANLLTCAETGRIGGLARAKKLTPEQRRQIAQRAAQARWARKHTTPDPAPPTTPDPKGPHREVQYAEAGIMSTPPVSGIRKPASSTPRSLHAA